MDCMVSIKYIISIQINLVLVISLYIPIGVLITTRICRHCGRYCMYRNLHFTYLNIYIYIYIYIYILTIFIYFIIQLRNYNKQFFTK